MVDNETIQICSNRFDDEPWIYCVSYRLVSQANDGDHVFEQHHLFQLDITTMMILEIVVQKIWYPHII